MNLNTMIELNNRPHVPLGGRALGSGKMTIEDTPPSVSRVFRWTPEEKELIATHIVEFLRSNGWSEIPPKENRKGRHLYTKGINSAMALLPPHRRKRTVFGRGTKALFTAGVERMIYDKLNQMSGNSPPRKEQSKRRVYTYWTPEEQQSVANETARFLIELGYKKTPSIKGPMVGRADFKKAVIAAQKSVLTEDRCRNRFGILDLKPRFIAFLDAAMAAQLNTPAPAPVPALQYTTPPNPPLVLSPTKAGGALTAALQAILEPLANFESEVDSLRKQVVFLQSQVDGMRNQQPPGDLTRPTVTRVAIIGCSKMVFMNIVERASELKLPIVLVLHESITEHPIPEVWAILMRYVQQGWINHISKSLPSGHFVLLNDSPGKVLLQLQLWFGGNEDV